MYLDVSLISLSFVPQNGAKMTYVLVLLVTKISKESICIFVFFKMLLKEMMMMFLDFSSSRTLISDDPYSVFEGFSLW